MPGALQPQGPEMTALITGKLPFPLTQQPGQSHKRDNGGQTALHSPEYLSNIPWTSIHFLIFMHFNYKHNETCNLKIVYEI